MVEKKTGAPPIAIREKSADTKEREITMPSASEAARTPRSYETQDETSSYEEYLFGRGAMAQGSKDQAWSDTTKGRVMIRLFSRGIVGAAAFALGGRYANKHLQNYDELRWDPKEPLHWIAKTVDTVIGKPIAKFTRTIAPEGMKDEWVRSATRFRSKAYFYNSELGYPTGRSLGAEMVQVSFDFACASVGDATTRNIIQAFDPNVQKPWIVDGKFDFDKWQHSVRRATWRILTKNAGEDWGAALPYVYQMKWQRQALAKLFPGSKLMLDYGWNGGSFKVDHQGTINGNYQLAGALDLQCRFVGYNFYTLMYRDAYDAIGRGINNLKKNHFKVDVHLPDNPIETALGGVGNTLRYVAKSFIKANLYMQPAVPFFWMFRTPQTKWRASPVCAEHPSGYGIMTSTPINSPDVHLDKNGIWVNPLTAAQRHENSSANRLFQGGLHTKTGGETAYFGKNPVNKQNYDPFAWENQKGLFAKILNPFGWVSYQAGSGLVRLADSHLNETGRFSRWVLGERNLATSAMDQRRYREMTIRSFTDAAFAYTPYMIAKAEFGLRVDDRPAGGGLGEMDKAIYGAIDSLGTLKFNEFGKYVQRIGHLVTDQAAVEVKAREGDPVKPGDKKGDEGKTVRIVGDGSLIPKLPANPASRIEKSTIVDHHKDTLSGQPKDAQTWQSYIADKRDGAQLHPTHPTVQ